MLLQLGWFFVLLITKVDEEGPASSFDCAVAPHYQILRGAFQQVQSVMLLTNFYHSRSRASDSYLQQQ